MVSPLDPDWSPESAAAPASMPSPSTHAPASVPEQNASPFTSAAPAVPSLSAPAPTAPAPPAPYAVPDPTVDVPASSPAPNGSTPSGGHEPHESAGRSALEEDSAFEAGLLTELLIEVLEKGASDLHITAGARPTIRLHGSLGQLEERPILTPPVIQRMMYAILTQRQREKFEEELELDFAYAVPGKARFRVNLYRQRDALGAAFRLIPYEIKALEDLGIPPSISNFAMLPRGFVLVTGPTGSGKSTTLASLIDLANRQRRDHIMTVEDPIEFLHRHKSCLVNQREVGEDTWSFQNALK
ncbi:MAG TPA: ATPase, T2SS/T4P/T4SS family, partial [Acidimicrobiales bacterium]|nr:ATPase, T2SS/T4P/T4SS family [Acidimicrobiales bacterium]